ATLTMVGASGQPNVTDRLRVTNAAGTTLLVTDPFPGTSVASDRSWANLTTNVSQLMGVMPAVTDPNYHTYGETLTATVDHTSRTPYDCIAWGAIVMSSAVRDVDGDGAPDGIEDGLATKDADGSTLPNLSAMNGSSLHKDIY